MNTAGRRSSEVKGMVNFPVDSTEFVSSGEGGMFVRLVVVSPDSLPSESPLSVPYSEDKLDRSVCCGGDVYVVYDETFVGDDVHPVQVQDWEKVSTEAEFRAAQHAERVHDRIHFPRMDDKSWSDIRDFMSIPYLAAVLMGSTGWSGWNELESKYWHCTKDNLNDDGKALYNQLQKAFPNSILILQTWLDT